MTTRNPDSSPDRPTHADFVFDDEPLERVLYGQPGPGPTPASLLASLIPELEAIYQSIEQDDLPAALRGMAELLARGAPIPQEAFRAFADLIEPLIPDVPCPEVEDAGVAYDVILDPIFRAAVARKDDALIEKAGTPLYRWHEARACYTDAAHVVAVMLDHARRRRNREGLQAKLTNNLGYEYLLIGDWARAAPYFARAAEMFGALGETKEQANVRLNGLLCRYELNGCQPWDGLDAELENALTILRRDWRRRKALMIQARVAERNGNMAAAIRFAETAVKAATGKQSQHRAADQAYLRGLRALHRG
jgi:hypothetical protein